MNENYELYFKVEMLKGASILFHCLIFLLFIKHFKVEKHYYLSKSPLWRRGVKEGVGTSGKGVEVLHFKKKREEGSKLLCILITIWLITA